MLMRTLATLAAVSAAGCATGGPGLADVPLPQGLVAVDVKPAAHAVVAFLEGPAIDAAGNLYFSDIAGNRLLKANPAGEVSVFRNPAGRPNGNTIDRQGRLVTCEGSEQGPGGGRRITRTDLKTGAVEVLTDNFMGKRYNSPNDIVVDGLGRVWFTDPYYGTDTASLQLDHESVYRIDPDGRVTRVLTQPEIERPNGLALTPDGKTLYVVDSNSRPGGNRKIWSFRVGDDGMPADRKLVFDFGKGRGGDGLRLDSAGNLWVAGGVMNPRHSGENADVPPGVYVISPDGKLLGRIGIRDDLVTNVVFGGADGKTLFVTCGQTVYKFPLLIAGAKY